MKKYNPKIIEKKWQKIWEDSHTFEAQEDNQKQKFYPLIEFPYPSGAGLHVGHVRPFTAMDVIARKRRMEGYNVLYPIGFDAFGLPTENFAIKTGGPPEEVTQENIANFTRQMKSLGLSFDWSRSVDTTDPQYYKWTQWIFLQFFKHGLAYKKNQPINWCPKDKIGLANEEVVNGCCERCGTPVERKNKEQWMLAITKYADKLLEGLQEVDYIPQAKVQQENWIGKSEGVLIRFPVILSELARSEESLELSRDPRPNVVRYGRASSAATPPQDDNGTVEVFTTRPDTLFGVTYLVIAPEHPLLKHQESGIRNQEEILKYAEESKKKSELERTELQKEKTGIELQGIKAVHPVTGEELPIWVADYVLGNYGTGAVMAVPAHDERDFEFAKKFNLPVKQVIAPHFFEAANPPRSDKKTVYRKVVHAIVKRVRDGKILMLNWKTNLRSDGVGPHTFIIGGIEGEEDKVETAKREIQEETGYKNVRFVKELAIEVHSEYYAGHKNENRYAVVNPVYFELEDEECEVVREEEHLKHEVVWIEEGEVKKYINVVDGPFIWEWFQKGEHAYADDGVLICSDFLNGLSVQQAKQKIIEWLEEKGVGKRQVQYKLRDWVFSRQRYWGEPIPLVYCEQCAKKKQYQSKGEEINPGWIPYETLPLKLPKLEKYEPTDTGESPLSKIEEWVNTTCPRCASPAKRETDTMPNWAGSSWYFLRYADPYNTTDFFKESSFTFRPAISVASKDEVYFKAFKTIYADLEKQKIKIWAVNRLLLNGLNRVVWLPLRTVAAMAWQKDLEKISQYLQSQGYVFSKKEKYGWYFEKEEIKVEIIPVFQDDEKLFSYTPHGALQPMAYHDLPDVAFGNLFGFSYRTVSPEYNLIHYQFINEHEREDRKNLDDEEKIVFLQEWVRSKNSNILYWNQVDWYNGGMEHTVLHLLYSRFWNQFLFDLGLVPTREPYKKRTSHGMILAKGGDKMSKSKGNVVNPDEMVEKFGADALRTYIMFMGPFDQAVEWDTNGLVGVKRFLEKVWNYCFVWYESYKKDIHDDKAEYFGQGNDKYNISLNKTIKKVSEDIEKMNFNTAISSLMQFVNLIRQEKQTPIFSGGVMYESQQISLTLYQMEKLLKLLFPFAPHMTEYLWQLIHGREDLKHSWKTITYQPWPTYDPKFIQEQNFELAIQINGKLRDTVMVPVDISEEEVKQKALSSEKVQKWLEGKEPRKIIYVKGKLISIVI